MLDLKSSSDSTHAILDIIEELTGDRSYARFRGIVSAKIGGSKRIDREEIEIHLTYSLPNYAIIDIMWEESGYKAYKNLGLYGRMTTQYQKVRKGKSRSFKVISNEYEIKVQY